MPFRVSDNTGWSGQTMTAFHSVVFSDIENRVLGKPLLRMKQLHTGTADLAAIHTTNAKVLFHQRGLDNLSVVALGKAGMNQYRASIVATEATADKANDNVSAGAFTVETHCNLI